MRTLLASLTLCTAASLSATGEGSRITTRGNHYQPDHRTGVYPFLVASHSPADHVLFTTGGAPAVKLAADGQAALIAGLR
jgi:hypothetical protein